jgi:hypothetical protein
MSFGRIVAMIIGGLLALIGGGCALIAGFELLQGRNELGIAGLAAIVGAIACVIGLLILRWARNTSPAPPPGSGTSAK